MNQLKQGAKGILDQVTGRALQPIVDPAKFDDPVARETDWDQKQKSQVMFRTHRLKATSSEDVVFQSTLAYKLFAVLAFLGGGALLAMAIPNRDVWVFAGIGAVIMLAGLYLLIFTLGPIGFYRGEQEFRRGSSLRKTTVPFKEIHALQLLTKVSRIQNDPHTGSSMGHSGGISVQFGRRRTARDIRSQELNLVRHDGSREHVLTYQDPAEALKDAEVIAGKLGIPVWNGMDGAQRMTMVYNRFR